MTLTDYMYEDKEEENSPRIDDTLGASIQRLENYIETRREGLITATRNDTDNTKSNWTIKTRKQKWEEKQLHGRFKRLISNIWYEKTWTRKLQHYWQCIVWFGVGFTPPVHFPGLTGHSPGTICAFASCECTVILPHACLSLVDRSLFWFLTYPFDDPDYPTIKTCHTSCNRVILVPRFVGMWILSAPSAGLDVLWGRWDSGFPRMLLVVWPQHVVSRGVVHDTTEMIGFSCGSFLGWLARRTFFLHRFVDCSFCQNFHVNESCHHFFNQFVAGVVFMPTTLWFIGACDSKFAKKSC